MAAGKAVLSLAAVPGQHRLATRATTNRLGFAPASGLRAVGMATPYPADPARKD